MSGDPIVESVRKRLALRSEEGQRKYGTTLMRTDLSQLAWFRHLQEELLDAALYVERLIVDETRHSDDGR